MEEQFVKEVSDEGVNYILKLPGPNPKLDPMLIAVHYDGPIKSSGSDDNASGVIALFELIKR